MFLIILDCGNTLIDGAVQAPDADCNMGCSGNAASVTLRNVETITDLVYRQACGGPNRLSVYSTLTNVTSLPDPTTLTTGLATNWVYSGCLQ
jgi:hypothetical protein